MPRSSMDVLENGKKSLIITNFSFLYFYFLKKNSPSCQSLPKKKKVRVCLLL